jgi:hypothetical protein
MNNAICNRIQEAMYEGRITLKNLDAKLEDKIPWYIDSEQQQAPIDMELQRRVKDLDVRADELAIKIQQCRKDIPHLIKQKIQEIPQLEVESLHEQWIKTTTSTLNIDNKLIISATSNDKLMKPINDKEWNQVLNQTKQVESKLQQLKKSLPSSVDQTESTLVAIKHAHEKHMIAVNKDTSSLEKEGGRVVDDVIPMPKRIADVMRENDIKRVKTDLN